MASKGIDTIWLLAIIVSVGIGVSSYWIISPLF